MKYSLPVNNITSVKKSYSALLSALTETCLDHFVIHPNSPVLISQRDFF
jgi:hypothetical protein